MILQDIKREKVDSPGEFDSQAHTEKSNCEVKASFSILVVTAMYPHSGNEGYGAFVMQQVEQLRALGHTVDVLHFPGYRSKLEYLKAAIHVFRRTRAKDYDLLHAHYGLTGLATLCRNSVPLVISIHGSDGLVGRIEPFISRFTCNRADAVIVASAGIAERIPGNVIPCGVDLDAFSPKSRAAARQRLGLSLARKYLLFPFDPARPVKRFELAKAAVEHLKREVPELELLVVWRAENGEMPWYYSAADAMILCSRSEASPTSVKEALACNLPVVSTDVGDVRKIMRGIAGVEITEATPESLAAGLKSVLKRSTSAAFDGRTPMQRYSQRETVEAIVRVYRGVMERNGVPFRSTFR
jgi:teichuronic acid biosynthesis glycosyltransferase TuaC